MLTLIVFAEKRVLRVPPGFVPGSGKREQNQTCLGIYTHKYGFCCLIFPSCPRRDFKRYIFGEQRASSSRKRKRDIMAGARSTNFDSSRGVFYVYQTNGDAGTLHPSCVSRLNKAGATLPLLICSLCFQLIFVRTAARLFFCLLLICCFFVAFFFL